MSDQSGYGCVLPFDTDNEHFARGFEAGRLWELLKHALNEELDGQLFHGSNGEMVMRMIESLDREGISFDFSVDPDWMVFVAH